MAEETQIAPGLYLVATPIGSARDITLRALDILRDAPVLAAEDTRTLRRLLEIHGVPLNGRPVVAYHDHSSDKVRARLLNDIAEGRAVAYASEAGTPLIADPGYRLSVAVREAGLPVLSAPGASAVLAALTVAGLPTDRFMFIGFLPTTKSARRKALSEVKSVRATLVFYEAPGRVRETLSDLEYVLGPEREAAVCRELTKKFEAVARGSLAKLSADYAKSPPRGEVVVLVDRGADTPVTEEDMRDALRQALKQSRLKDAASEIAEAFGVPRRDAYQMALSLQQEAEDEG